MPISRNYPRLDPVTFGRQLLLTGDLDPVYVALNGCNLSADQRNRWLCAYIAFYHAGVASWMSEREGKEFWAAMQTAAVNAEETPVGGRWPRASERRHFRGEQAVKAVVDWKARDERPEFMFEYIAGNKPSATFEEVSGRANSFRSFGSWANFKASDLVDACCGVEIDQTKLEPFLYSSPKKQLLEWANTIPEIGANSQMGDIQKCVLGFNWLREQVSDLSPPHKPGKPVDLFCLESWSCKFGSHVSGSYPVGHDIKEISSAVSEWAKVSDTALLFSKELPKMEAVDVES